MKALFISGDVGGARALLPVIRQCEAAGLDFCVARHGYIATELLPHWPQITIEPVGLVADCDLFEQHREIGVVIFASSVHDRTPLRVACAAQQRNIPVIHLLDNWTSYRQRLEEDGVVVLRPEVYAVMDLLAKNEAVQDGIPAETIRITGQPALASLQQYCMESSWGEGGAEGCPGHVGPKSFVVFVSEPVLHDQGGPGASSFRGYVEEEALSLFCQLLQPYAASVAVGIIPHPREDALLLQEYWQKWRGNLTGSVLEGKSGREWLCRADGVAGMASILLYEAWLLNKPVLSVQPGVRGQALRALAKRAGVFFADEREKLASLGAVWLKAVASPGRLAVRPELAAHAAAPLVLADMIRSFLGAMEQVALQGSTQ